jgi:predicted esterase
MLVLKTQAQSVIDPNDPVNEYDPAHPPAVWDYFHPIVKWVRTLQIENGAVQYRNPNWTGETNYKAYTYNGLAFRVEFPKSYNPAATKKYPLIIFLHGQGENDVTYKPPTPNYDNEWQLLQGPPRFDEAIQNGTYDGYVLAPQLQDPAVTPPREVYYENTLRDIMNIVKYMINNNNVDPYHIVVNGLSEGGLGSWDILNQYPTYFAGVTPMSSPITFQATQSYVANKLFLPIWTSQGGTDTHPTPAETQAVRDSFLKYGGNFTETFYPLDGHNTWDNFWGEKNFWPFINSVYSSNPWMLGGLKSYWPTEPINATIGVTPGFAQYQWRRNGADIAGATTNTLHVTAAGLYEARVLRDSVWSDWSHVPINIRPGFYEAENYVAKSVHPQPENTIDAGGGQNMGYIGQGDWMDYTLNVYTPGTYTLLLRVASTVSGGVIQVRNSDSAVLATVNVEGTGGFQTWKTISTTVTFTSAGIQNIRLQSAGTVDWNINWFQFVTTSNSPLPVKFVYFNAQCNGNAVNLQWRTAQEQNTKDFSIQRSTDGSNWTEIGKSGAAGQSAQERGYSFVDKNPSASGMYRIVETDMTGQQIITTIVRSSCSTTKETVSLYPNPFAQNSSVNITLNQSQRIKLRVVEATGAIIQQKELLLPSGNSSIPLVMSSYPKGVYAVTVQYSGQVKTLKFIKN